MAGYFTSGTTNAVYHALGPDRIVDTRIGLGTAGPGTLGANATLGFPIRVPDCPRPIRLRSRPPGVKFAPSSRLLALHSPLVTGHMPVTP